LSRHPAVPYVVPFAVFIALLVAADYLSFLGRWEYPFRVIVLLAVLWYFARDVIDLKLRFPIGTILMGIGVFVIWVAPDALFPGYREHWLFQNPITGKLQISISPELRQDTMVLAIRFFRAAVIVPIVEELFWRAWLMRWLINNEFWKVPLGAYSTQAFWIVAVLFASEHGPYWEVGLIAGILYNWWMVRTKSLGDLIWAHAITNACLSAYVLVTNKWEYWM
jgi:CAAX prenyl protease-like protein